MGAYEVVELGRGGRDEEWQAYVGNAPHASLYHALEWRDILVRSFQHRAVYLMARENGTTRGVLPLFEMQSMLFGHFFVSLPFLDYSGILADTPDCETALAIAASDLARRREAQYIELRQSHPAAQLVEGRWSLRQHKVALVIPLSNDPKAHWSELSSRLRGKVRKAKKFGITVLACGAECLDCFYRVFALNMRDLGTPVYSPAFFQNIFRLAEDATILLAHREGRPVSGAIALRHGDRIELPWICSDYSHSSFYANECLYWGAIEWACGIGARELDLGRSTLDSGACRFKIQWNPKVRPLFWYYWLAPGNNLPELNPTNPRYSLAIRCWKHMPLALANRVGPWIVRNIP
ncbi:FemAB family XrtA/PEP-CTERM system-associated protein [Microvirga massiliensis]|uniref:FemAB family XrtA/PEP-CTERM system-associated protein n=1 Tax=Microvirga massiliensis TaxID=1033741 RepID=UPI00062B8F5F